MNNNQLSTKKIAKGLYAAKLNDLVFAIFKETCGCWKVEFLNTSKEHIRTDLDDCFFITKAGAIHQSLQYWNWLN